MNNSSKDYYKNYAQESAKKSIRRSTRKFKREIVLPECLNKKCFGAFSLIEFAVVLTVVAVVVSGFLSLTVSDRSNVEMDSTNSKIAKINKALQKFVLENKRMPCPASIKLTRRGGDATYGNEGGDPGECSIVGTYESTSSDLIYGAIPVRALGLPNDFANDAYSNKFVYIIDKGYTDASTFTTEGGVLIIKEYRQSESGLKIIEANAMFTIISYGPNKKGSFTRDSSIINTVSTDEDEMHNAITSLDETSKTAAFTNSFVKRTERSDSKFDDVIFYKSRSDFLMDAKAEFLVNSNITSNAIATIDCGVGYVASDGACDPVSFECSGYSVVGSRRVHILNSSISLSCIGQTSDFDILVVGGGGKGGDGYDNPTNCIQTGAGGGAGGGTAILLSNQSVPSDVADSSGTTIAITVGNSGEDSSVSGAGLSITALRGSDGVSAYNDTTRAMVSGANNAGDASNLESTTGATPNGFKQGNNYAGGGGTGERFSGVSASSSTRGHAGAGKSYIIAGITAIYGAGGGGGGCTGSSGGACSSGSISGGDGAADGGGAGAGPSNIAGDGTPNTGNGGGGGCPINPDAGSGGSGIVIISYPHS